MRNKNAKIGHSDPLPEHAQSSSHVGKLVFMHEALLLNAPNPGIAYKAIILGRAMANLSTKEYRCAPCGGGATR